MKYIFYLLSALIFSYSAYGEKQEFDTKDLRTLLVQNTSGDVKIHTSSEKYASIDISKKDFDPKKCKINIDNQTKKLFIRVETMGVFSENHCRIDFDIMIPKSVDLDLINGSGNLEIHDINGKLNFKIGSGDINAEGNFDIIEGTSGSGDIFIKGVHKGGKIQIGSGNVVLHFGQNIKTGELDVRSGSGNVNLFFSKKTRLFVDFKSGSGKFINELSNDTNGSFKVSVRTGSGNLSIKRD